MQTAESYFHYVSTRTRYEPHFIQHRQYIAIYLTLIFHHRSNQDYSIINPHMPAKIPLKTCKIHTCNQLLYSAHPMPPALLKPRIMRANQSSTSHIPNIRADAGISPSERNTSTLVLLPCFTHAEKHKCDHAPHHNYLGSSPKRLGNTSHDVSLVLDKPSITQAVAS